MAYGLVIAVVVFLWVWGNLGKCGPLGTWRAPLIFPGCPHADVGPTDVGPIHFCVRTAALVVVGCVGRGEGGGKGGPPGRGEFLAWPGLA